MEKARDINISRRVSSSLLSQIQLMFNASKSTLLSASFDEQQAFNKALNQALNQALKHHAVSFWKTHEKPPNLSGRKINFQNFLRYFLQSVVTRLSVLFNVTRIFNSFAFADEVFDDEMNADDANGADVVDAADAVDAANAVNVAWILFAQFAAESSNRWFNFSFIRALNWAIIKSDIFKLTKAAVILLILVISIDGEA